jgi:hypothetical protein
MVGSPRNQVLWQRCVDLLDVGSLGLREASGSARDDGVSSTRLASGGGSRQ